EHLVGHRDLAHLGLQPRDFLVTFIALAVLQCTFRAGEHTVTLSAVGGETLELGRYRLERGETLFVIARSLGSRLYAHAIGGVRLDLPPDGPTPLLDSAPESPAGAPAPTSGS
ncbi:MAG: hypothetical protein HUU28_06030, partial [Planctomycetaceae bacterium]|nr:hypothetical protein [Planctomycetaceae bacterium]